jgi:hypothetical protein
MGCCAGCFCGVDESRSKALTPLFLSSGPRKIIPQSYERLCGNISGPGD